MKRFSSNSPPLPSFQPAFPSLARRREIMDPLKKVPASVRSSHAVQSALPRSMFSLEDVRRFSAELEAPFPTSLLEWRVVNTSEDGIRGQIAPYADPRAYTDRLNEIFTPAG